MAVNPNIGPIGYRREYVRPSLGASIGAGLATASPAST